MSQSIIVTGASAGIGLAMAKYLLTLPSRHRVILCCNTNDAPLKALAEESSNSNRVFIVKGDLASPSFVDTVLAQSLLHFEIERIDAVVLNHGTLGNCARIADMQWDEWESVMGVNVGSYVSMVCPLSEQGSPGQRYGKGRYMRSMRTMADGVHRSGISFLTYEKAKVGSS